MERHTGANGGAIVRTATDVGGTFTDIVSLSVDPATGKQTVVTAKTDTTPPEFDRGVLNVLAKAGVDPGTIDHLIHGSTVVINALTERKGARVGLITTEGFRDSIEIARGNRPDFFNLRYRKPPPFVPRDLRREIPGRLTHDGRERAALDLAPLEGIVSDFKREGVEAIAVCLLHSYANPDHERRVAVCLEELWPGTLVVTSHQITREWREYERTNTAALCAYVQPTAARYLNRLESSLDELAFDGRMYVMQSNCGVDSIERAREVPITMVESGPASGILGAAELGKLIGEPDILALDIGGTTAKCSLLEDGEVRVETDYWIERSQESGGYPIMVPVVDLIEIGAGGGSIATVDEHSKLRVGPQSAGALPGPVSYGKGGTEVTTTDANLMLGRINPDYFCGGEIEADMEAVEHGLTRLGESLGVSAREAARGIVRIANHNMVNALKLVSLNRGHDPRDFTLVAFGGGGPMHAVPLARELGMRRVVIPKAAEVFSAWGMLMGDLRRDFFQTRFLPLTLDGLGVIEETMTEIRRAAIDHFAREGVPAENVQIRQSGLIRYENQENSVETTLPSEPIGPDWIEAVKSAFDAEYSREYSYTLDAEVELVGFHFVATAGTGKLSPRPGTPTSEEVTAAVKGRREVDFADDGVEETSIYDGDLLAPGMCFSGPAIVETAGTTSVINPGARVEVDSFSNLRIELDPADTKPKGADR